MRHTKLIVLGIILVAAVVFGSIFWSDFMVNQQEIANTPVPPSPLFDTDSRMMDQGSVMQQATADMSTNDDYDSMESDLDKTEVDDMDSESSQLEAEAGAL